MHFRGHLTILLSTATLLLSSCQPESQKPKLDSQKFARLSGEVILCFDLSSDLNEPTGGLILRVSSTPNELHRNILLPFPTKQVAPNREMLLASETYEGKFTTINVSTGTSNTGAPAVSFIPRYHPLSVDKPSLQGIDKPGVYFYKNGLERWFIFVDDSPSMKSSLEQNFAGLKFSDFESVAIAIPENSEGRDIELGSSIVPQTYQELENVVFFSSPQNAQGDNKIALRYTIPAKGWELAISNSGTKLVFVLLIPLATLILLDPDEIQNRRLRNIAILGFFSLQAIIVGMVVWVTLATGSFSVNVWIDLSLSGLGFISQVVILLVKRKKALSPNSSSSSS